jgi:hypothetical protein
MIDVNRRRLETASIVVGYAMSRLDSEYLRHQQTKSWCDAYDRAAAVLQSPPTTFKNLRDEFDPFHANPRRGWHRRPLRQDRQRVFDELADLSEEALLELVSRILRKDEDEVVEAIDSMSVVTGRAYNVAERLLTGRLAEEFFLANSFQLVGYAQTDIIDMRQAASGFDFAVNSVPDIAIEIKGMKTASGKIQFTDKEWTQARQRGPAYALVVVGSLPSHPLARVIWDPHSVLRPECKYRTCISAVWQSNVSVI